jgi:AcrR family transcriptional regulator
MLLRRRVQALSPLRQNDIHMSTTTPGAAQKENETRCRIIATAERLFREIGYQKTTVADIARNLSMSAGNVYRFFTSKAEINEAVGRQLMGEVEDAARAISEDAGPAADRLRRMIQTVERMNAERYVSDFKLHEMVSVALTENWAIVQEHILRMDGYFAKIIADGIDAGEFHKQDPMMAARTVHTATVRFCHPRLMVECCQMTEPTLDRMVDFCLRALRA